MKVPRDFKAQKQVTQILKIVFSQVTSPHNRGNGLQSCHEGSTVYLDLRPILKVITSSEMKLSTEF